MVLDEQAAFAAVHSVAVERGLPSAMVAELRCWAAMRMRKHPGSVWHGSTLRRSFLIAIEHAAETLELGSVPD